MLYSESFQEIYNGLSTLATVIFSKRRNPYNNTATDYLHLRITIKKLMKTNILAVQYLIIYVLYGVASNFMNIVSELQLWPLVRCENRRTLKEA
ncbi:hypothetical protein J14TS5_27990 [Paenibacillus lautus]|nr:hypothetical protein J14TS5_27990 [Paenibacillus lautus]